MYPDGLYLLLKRFAAYGWPLYVTENGLADAQGTRRPLFLAQHLAALERAVDEGADVRGYFHWSLLDNFEWADGFASRFGLFHVDYEQGAQRSPTPAVETFARLRHNLR
jgi:beta-glucosidase